MISTAEAWMKKKRSEEKLKTFKRDINKRTFVNVEFDKKTLPTCC